MGEIGPDANPAVAALTDVLKSNKNASVRIAASLALLRIAKPGDLALPDLLDLLKSPESEVRCETLEALDEWGPAASNALRAILQLLRDEDASVRATAVSVVASVAPNSADVLEALTETLRDTDGTVRLHDGRPR